MENIISVPSLTLIKRRQRLYHYHGHHKNKDNLRHRQHNVHRKKKQQNK